MKKNHGFKPHFFIVPAIAVVVMMVFATAIMAQGPKNANPNSPMASSLGFQAYDSASKQVGKITNFNEDYRVAVAVDVTDISGKSRRVMMNLQRPNANTPEAFSENPALFGGFGCASAPYQAYTFNASTFPALSEAPTTTIFRDQKVEVWLPISGQSPAPLPVTPFVWAGETYYYFSRMERNGECIIGYVSRYEDLPVVVPLELVAPNFFSQFPPPYNVK
jgi:hypothetical protein